MNVACVAAERKFNRRVTDDVQSAWSAVRLAGGCNDDK